MTLDAARTLQHLVGAIPLTVTWRADLDAFTISLSDTDNRRTLCTGDFGEIEAFIKGWKACEKYA